MLLSLSEQLAQIDNFAGAGDKHTQRGRERGREQETDRQLDSRRRSRCRRRRRLQQQLEIINFNQNFRHRCLSMRSIIVPTSSKQSKQKVFLVSRFLVSRFLFLISLAIIHGQLRSAFVLRQQHHLYYSAAPPNRPLCLSFSSAGQSAHRAMRALRRVVSSRAKVKYTLPRDLYYRYEVIDQN